MGVHIHIYIYVYREAWAISWVPFWLWPFLFFAELRLRLCVVQLLSGWFLDIQPRLPKSISTALVGRHYRHLNPLFVSAARAHALSEALDSIWQIENPFVASSGPCVHAWPYPAVHNFNPGPQKCLLICIAEMPESSQHSLRFNYSLLGLVLIRLPSIYHCSLRLHNFAVGCESRLAEKYTS